MPDRLARSQRAADRIQARSRCAVERTRGFTERVTALGRAETLSVNERLWVDRLRKPGAR
ncbi:hypothetical protein JOD64_002791 [Micromonospora luteifusca]|uniref:Uncharacterized protein n=1 Tax=Micromonospora luteifusca TaxID=709860 RepID=A0ABS2LVA4_9ACTN|nr:hypothetical protein [Micromonospora luteifusca]